MLIPGHVRLIADNSITGVFIIDGDKSYVQFDFCDFKRRTDANNPNWENYMKSDRFKQIYDILNS
jgi:hypothetical protein